MSGRGSENPESRKSAELGSESKFSYAEASDSPSSIRAHPCNQWLKIPGPEKALASADAMPLCDPSLFGL
jgi:hypothetical protein